MLHWTYASDTALARVSGRQALSGKARVGNAHPFLIREVDPEFVLHEFATRIPQRDTNRPPLRSQVATQSPQRQAFSQLLKQDVLNPKVPDNCRRLCLVAALNSADEPARRRRCRFSDSTAFTG